MRHIRWAVLLLIVAIGCKPPVHKAVGISNIDLVSLRENPLKIGLSGFAKSVEYIALETRPDVLLGPIKYCVGKNWIYVLSTKDHRVFLFDRQGKFIRNIGSPGKGPGEYPDAQDIQVSPDGNRIYLYSTRTSSIYEYDVQGVLLNHSNISYASWRFARLSSGNHLMIAPYGDFTFMDSGKFLYFIQDSTGAVIRKFQSENIIRMMGNFGIGQFYINPLTVLSFVEFNDTIYQFDEYGGRSPKYVMNFGKFRIPNDAHEDMSVLQQNQYQYITNLKLVESGPGLFLRYICQNEFRIGFYAYDNQPVKSIQNSKGMIINDLDGGPDFFPASSDGFQELYSLLNPVELLMEKTEEVLNSKEFTRKDAHKSYLKFLDTIKEDDNPVIMLVRLK